MDPDTIIGLGRDCLTVTAMLAGPLLLVGLVVGLLVSIFQTITSINEQTLTFLPKMAAMVGCFALFMPWFIRTICAYTTALLENLHLAAR